MKLKRNWNDTVSKLFFFVSAETDVKRF